MVSVSAQDDEDFGSNNDLNFIKKLETIGSGTYGVVYKGIVKDTDELIAIKKIKIELESEGVPSTALREICILRDLSHPNIVDLKDVVCSNNKLFLLFEYLELDLKKYVESLPKNEKLKPELVKSFMYQILDGLAYCHAKRIIHRDLKPQNLLLNKNLQLKLADFGLARAFSLPIRPYTKEVLTLWYRGPEILLGTQEYCKPVDIWSVGCIFAELCLGQPIFQGESDIDQLMKIFKTLGTPDEDIWPDITTLPFYKDTFPKYPANKLEDLISNLDSDGINLLNKMLTYDPNQRISAKEALKHNYFKSMKKTK
jgi:serine/threonine protein kinase